MSEETTMHRFLRRLKLGAIALVPKGANPGAQIAIAKNSQISDGEPTVPPTSGSANEENEVDLTKIAEALGLEKDADEEAVLAEVGKRHDLGEVAKALELDGDEVTPEQVVKAIEELDDTGDGEDEGDAAGNGDDEPAAELRKELANARKRADDQDAEIKELRKEARERTFVAKAEEFKQIGDPKIIGALLDEADEKLSDGAQKTLDKVLKGAAEQIETSELFKQLSDPDAQPEESAEVRLEKAARKIMEDDSKLSFEQAKVKAADADPNLKKAIMEAKS